MNAQELWVAFTKRKQTYKQLAEQHGCSAKTIQRTLDRYKPVANTVFEPVANVVMDTTYFGRSFGVMVFKESISRKILYKRYVKYETNQLYSEGIKEIARRGISIQSIVCDGRKGLVKLFDDIPTQMCQFHQVLTITRYLTRRPKTQAGLELRQLSLELKKASQVKFKQQLNEWENKWGSYLKERTINPATGKSFYTHKRLRSAYLSLKRNLPYLFVFEDYPHLKMHHTTNALDGIFSDLKNKLRNHNGLSLDRKKKFIDEFFKA